MSLPASTSFTSYIANALVANTDLINDEEATRNLVSSLASFLTGAPNLLPPALSGSGYSFTPLAIAPSGSALSYTIGGTGQQALVQGRVCDTCPATVQAISANSSGSTRTDLIQVKYGQVQSTYQVVNLSTGGTGNEYYVTETAVFGYKVGTTTPDAGYVAFATIAVPNGATLGTSCTFTVLFPTWQYILEQLVSGASGSPGHGTTTTSNPGGAFTIPAVNGTVTLSIVDGTAFPNSNYAVISDGTHAIYGQITSGGTTSSPTFKNLAVLAGAVGNTMAAGATVTFAGPAGPSGTSGYGSTTTTGSFAVPAVNATANVGAANGTAFPNGTPCVISDGTHAFAGTIQSGGTTNALVVLCTQILLGSAGSTMANGATITFGSAASIAPVGWAVAVETTYTDTASPKTATLPTLPGSSSAQYYIEAHCQGYGLPQGNTSATVSMSGSGGTWPGSPATHSGYSYARSLYLAGTATGGQTPSVTFTSTVNQMLNGGGTGFLTIKAIRTS
jgi:hypothetical protein